MTTTRDYERVLITLKSMASKTDYNFIHLLNILTVEDIKDLVECIQNIQPLILFRNTHNIGSNACATLFTKALPLLFDKEELEKYFLNLLLLKYNNETTWEKPNKYEFFKESTGYTVERSSKRNFYIGIVYHDVYNNEFINNYYYPESYKQKTIKLINDNLPLVENYQEYVSKYAIGDDSYLVYLDTYIIDRVGVDKFRNYLEVMTNSYISSLSIVSLDTVTNDKLLNFIFGYNWGLLMHIYDYVSGRRKNKPRHFRLHLMLLEIFFPKTIGNYQSKKNRNTVYKLLNFTEEQINQYEDLSRTINRQNRITAIGIIDDATKIELPSGKSIKYIHQYINDYFEKLKQTSRIVGTKNGIFKELKSSTSDQELIKDLNSLVKSPSRRSTLYLYIEKQIIDTKAYFFEHNKDELNKKQDCYIIYYRKHENYAYRSFDLQSLNSDILKQEIRMFLRYKISNHYQNDLRINRIVEALAYMESKFQINKSKDITQWQVLRYLHYLEIEKELKPITLQATLGVLKDFLSYLLGKDDYVHKLTSNPALNIKLANIREHINSTPVIPDDILVFLDKHIQELKQKDYILIYKILIETGWRFNDIRSILTCDIKAIPNNNELASISTSSPKTKKSRINKRLGDKIDDVISIDLYNEIQLYISETQPIREMYNIKTLFYSIANNAVTPINVENFNKALNKLCSRYNIKSIDSSYWGVSSKQTRKTVASTLITSGAPTAAVQKKLGHVSSETTARYYAEVQQKKIGELNTEFYAQKFNVYMDEEKLKLFTEEERKILYIDFCLNKRNVELGICSKHPSEGRCATLGHTTCAKCPKLCTGKKYLEPWEKLKDSSKSLLQQFIATYEKHHIPQEEYQEYIEYKQELELYNHYTAVIDAIRKENT